MAVSFLIDDRDPVPRIGLNRHPGFDAEGGANLRYVFRLALNQGRESIKLKSASRYAFDPLITIVDWIVAPGYGIFSEAAIFLVKLPPCNDSVALCVHSREEEHRGEEQQ